MVHPASSDASRLIADSLDPGLLADIVREFLEPYAGVCTIHERNGDCSLRLLSCGWRQCLDAAALERGEWPCHTAHEEASRRSVETGEPVEEECPGGVRILAAPIRADGEIVGGITMGCGDPPRDPAKLRTIADAFGLSLEDLSERAAAWQTQPALSAGLAKKRLLSAARFIGEIVRRTRVERALAESEKRFADFMAHLPAGVFIRDHAGRLLYANRFMMEDVIGSKDCVGRTVDELVPREAAKRIMADDLRVLSGEPVTGEVRLRDSSGAERFFDDYRFPIEAPDGRVLVAGIAVESTERKRAEQAVRTSESFLASIIDQSPYPMWISDREGTLVKINQSLRNLLHVTDEDVVGKYNILKDNIVEEQNLMPLVRRVFEEGVPVRFEIRWDSVRLRHVRWSGDVSLILDVSIFPIRDARGVMTNAVIQHVDVTERKRAEEALRESERRYRDLLENVHIVAIMLDLTGKITFCNDYLCAVTGWSRDEIVGRMFADLAAEDLSPGLLPKLIESAGQTGATGSALEGAILAKDGKPRWIQWNSVTLRNPAGQTTGFASLGVDVTEHRVLQQRYVQAQKLESVGRLAGGVAHDFNNLLTVISGYANLVLRGLSGESPLRDQVAEVIRAAERAASLTAQLLAFSRRQLVQFRPLDLNLLVANSLGMFERLVGEDVAVVTRFSSRPAQVLADPGQMHQVLMNLVANARDAMPGGGQLILETSHVELDAAFAATHPEVAPGSYVLLAVADTGVGMDAETQQHLFEPFFTTKATGEGAGLGLSIVYGIVRQSQGSVYVESEPGRGTTLKIYLPSIAAPPLAEAVPRQSPSSPRGEGTILVVEDQDQVRALAVAALRSSGYTVIEANCGAAALVLADGYPEPIHLLLTDAIMPGMSGRELAERLQPCRPAMKVLYMSGYTEDAILRRGVLDAGVEYLAKPFTPTQLAIKAAEVLARPDAPPVQGRTGEE